MKRTTIYLPDDIKAQLERVARAEGRTEADVIREALATALTQRTPPRPRLPLVESTGIESNVAEHIDEALAEGFGRT